MRSAVSGPQPIEKMARGELELKILSLREVVAHDYADSVTLPTTSGEITVLPNHTPLISALVSGTIRAKFKEGERSFAVQGGFVEVTPDSRLTVLLRS